MKITSVDLFPVPPRWLFVRIQTNDGLTGWGEPTVEGRALTTSTAVRELSDQLLGKDPRRIEDLFQAMHRGNFYRGGCILTSAISGVEQALWDIKAKSFGVPVYELLGGPVRDKMRLYAHIGGATPEACATAAKAMVDKGFTALKMSVTQETEWIESPAAVDRAVAMFAETRAAAGRDTRIAIDFHGRVHRAFARILAKELEQFSPYFYEELLLPEHNDALREVARAAAVPIATGERLYTRWEFKKILEDGVVDIVQPDVSHCGGIFEMRKIAAMAEAYDVCLAPHCPLGPVTFAASLQVDFCTPNALIQEQVFTLQNEYVSDYTFNDPPIVENGFIALPRNPGLGVDINEAAVREAANENLSWRVPRLRTADGAVAEW
jgi:galactonate dehydratase